MTCDDDGCFHKRVNLMMENEYTLGICATEEFAMVPRIIIQTGSLIKTGNCSLNRKKYIKEATISVTDVILRCICVI